MSMPAVDLTRTRSAHCPDGTGLVRLNRFAREHRLREMKFSGRNINRMIRRVAGPAVARGLVASYRGGSPYTYVGESHMESELRFGPFDHAECWGRDGSPLVLVGHPYQLDGTRSALLRGLEEMGFDLVVSSDAGWYGFGTYHVRASVPGALPRPTDAERFITEMLLDDPEVS